MKNLKTLGLLAVSIAAVTALLGASTASATVLCKNNLNTAACTEKFAAATLLYGGPTGSAIFESLAGEQLAKCTAHTTIMRVEGAGSGTTTVSGPFNTLTWGENGVTCEQVTETIKLGKWEIHHITNTDNGSVTASGTEITFRLEANDCIYGPGAGMIPFGTLEGGNPAVLKVNAVLAEQGTKKLACPDSVRLTAPFTIEEPNPLYVSAA